MFVGFERASQRCVCVDMWRRATIGQYRKSLVVVILDIYFFLFMTGPLFFPILWVRAYLLFNSNISQLSINIETDNKQNIFFSLFFFCREIFPHFMCWSRSEDIDELEYPYKKNKIIFLKNKKKQKMKADRDLRVINQTCQHLCKL
jgi:hypothetical protein